MFFSPQKTTDTPATQTASKKAFRKRADFLDWRESKDLLVELQSQKAELQRRVTDLEAQIGESDSDGRSDLRAAAAEMISGSTAATIAKPDVRIELNEARQHLAVVIEACQMQLQAAKEVAQTCAAEMSAERKPGHGATVQRIDAAIYELENSIADERAFREQMSDDGGGRLLPTIPLPCRMGWQRKNTWLNFHEWRQRMARLSYITYPKRRN